MPEDLSRRPTQHLAYAVIWRRWWKNVASVQMYKCVRWEVSEIVISLITPFLLMWKIIIIGVTYYLYQMYHNQTVIHQRKKTDDKHTLVFETCFKINISSRQIKTLSVTFLIRNWIHKYGKIDSVHNLKNQGVECMTRVAAHSICASIYTCQHVKSK